LGQALVEVPLTIPPDKHQPNVEVVTGTGKKGIDLKAITQMQCGAAGYVAWNLVTFSSTLATFSESFQVLPSKL